MEVVGVIQEKLCEVPTSFTKAWAQEGEQLASVVVTPLVCCYQSADQKFTLAPVHADASEYMEAATKENPMVDTTITRFVPGSSGLRCGP
jgi:hypothetical protein